MSDNYEPRADFGDPGGQPPYRPIAEKEAKQDLQKPIWQLVCDVHEEAHATNRSDAEKLVYATKRMTSMMGRVAVEHERIHKDLLTQTRKLVFLTWALLCLTVVLAVLTWWLIHLEYIKH